MGENNICKIIKSRGAAAQRASIKQQQQKSKAMYQLTITNMNTGEQQAFNYKSKKNAINHFIERCDERGYDWREMPMINGYEAGGIGHDLRLELIEEEEEETTTTNPF